MKDSDLSELEMKKRKLLAGMTAYMSDEEDEDFDAGYTEAHIKKCDEILNEFIGSLQKLDQEASDSQILKCVKRVVLELNKLNGIVDGCLIETDQREDLCEYIQCAAIHSGLKTKESDVTEEWREW